MTQPAPDQAGGTDKDDNVVVPEPDVAVPEKPEEDESDGGETPPAAH